MKTYFSWLDDGHTLEGSFSNLELVDATSMIEEFIRKMSERDLSRVNLMLNIADFALTRRNVTMLSNFILVLHEDRRLAWGVLYGGNKSLLRILGASITYSLGIRLKTTQTRAAALDLLEARQVAHGASWAKVKLI